jgi:hypothetical protein
MKEIHNESQRLGNDDSKVVKYIDFIGKKCDVSVKRLYSTIKIPPDVAIIKSKMRRSK